MAVSRFDGSWAWSDARGEADVAGRPMTPATPFCIASVTKLFVAVTVARAVARGVLSLDDRLVDLLPAEQVDGLHRLDGVDHTPSVTVRHLLAHASGLPDALEERGRSGRSLIEQVVDVGDREITLEDTLAVVRTELRPHFPPSDLSAPKARIRYSDTNYQLLMSVIETVTARPLGTVYRQELFDVAGMRRTWVPGDAAPMGGEAPEPAALWFGAEPIDTPRFLASVRDLYATVDDLVTFMSALVAGSLVTEPELWPIDRQRFRRFGLPRDRASLRSPGWPIEYGLGVMRFDPPRIVSLGRQVPAVFGHTGSTGSWLWWCPDLELVLAGTVDQGTAGAVPFRVLPTLLRTIAGIVSTGR